MTTYQVAIAYNNEAGLADIDPQPSLPSGLRYAETGFYGGGNVEVNGFLSGELVWNGQITRSQYNAILTAFGLSETTRSNEVTMQLRKNNDEWASFNVLVTYPDNPRRSRPTGNYWDDLTFVLNALEEIT